MCYMLGTTSIAVIITGALKMDCKMARKRRRKKARNGNLSQRSEQRAISLQHRNKLAETMQRGIVLHQKGQLEEAAHIYEQILLNNPQHFEALKLLGTLAYQSGKIQLAIELISRSIAINPSYADSHYNLGIALKKHGELEKAVRSYQRALVINPDYAEATYNLGIALQEQGKLEEAIQSYQKALVINPDYAKAHNNLGGALKEQGKLKEAIESYQRALVLNPEFDIAYYNLGTVLREQGKQEEAIQSYQRALVLNPDFAAVHNNLGAVLQEQGKLEEAIQSYQRALVLNPGYAEAHNNIGIALKDQGKLDKAIQAFRQALTNDPNYSRAHTSLIFCQDFMPDVDLAHQQIERKEWNRHFILPLSGQRQFCTNRADPDRILRIGYVSADFKRHSAAQGFADLILGYDAKQFQVYCYSGLERRREDEMTAFFQHQASNWRSTQGLNDADLAEQIRSDQIDILVDLSGHTAGNRLLTFGYKPAPIQVTGIGHHPPGLTTIDYRLTSRFQTFPQEEALFPEQPIYLDYAFGFYLHQIKLSITPLPAHRNEFLTFGCFNRWDKISSVVLSLWAELLLTIPDSRLILKAGQLEDKSLCLSTLNQMAQFGVSEERIDLRGRTSQQEHLAAYQEIDVSLDPFPQCGGITTIESLWMGVPVISLYSESKIVSRGASFLTRTRRLGGKKRIRIHRVSRILESQAGRVR